MARILLVDDDPAVAGITARILTREGHDVELATSGGEGLAFVAQRQPDLLLLDFELGDMEASDVLAELGGRRTDLPVIVLTGARLSPGDQVMALDGGAVDYLTKGVNSQVMLARIRSVLRRQADEGIIQRGRLRVDVGSSRAWLGDRALDLDRKPLLTLHHLALNEGVAVSRAELLEVVWQTGFKGFEHTVEQAVYTLRRQIGPGWIETIYRHGYRFKTVEE